MRFYGTIEDIRNSIPAASSYVIPKLSQRIVPYLQGGVPAKNNLPEYVHFFCRTHDTTFAFVRF